ncbi:MAG: hypothetical protein JSU01_11380 [Bacteroidetes bacterium]|nr:hypothetical protein [Bacteroidota bacterium]
MEETELQNELASIRSIMERSSKFISLSGLSGILAGVYALVGAGAAYKIIEDAHSKLEEAILRVRAQEPLVTTTPSFNSYVTDYSSLNWKLFAIAVIVLIASITTAILLSIRQAKRKNQPMWGSASRSLVFHTMVPLMAGGCLIAVLVFFKLNHFYHPYYGLVAPASLIFYGLALVSASNFTFGEVKYLGICEIILGLIAACLPGHGLLFWALGFGLLHIIYGARIYFKYDK